MNIAFALLLVAIGAILAFAVDVSVSGLDLAVVGWILMGVGVLALLLDLIIFAPRRRVTTVQRGVVPGERVVEQRRVVPTEQVVERRTYDDPML
jgi:hypothetical protein